MRTSDLSPEVLLQEDLEPDRIDNVVLNGFPELSKYIGSSSEFAIFRKFETLSARSLLYLQSQLLDIETQLKRYDCKDREAIKAFAANAADVVSAAKDWRSFERCSQAPDSCQMEKMKLVFKMRRVLKEYRKAVDPA